MPGRYARRAAPPSQAAALPRAACGAAEPSCAGWSVPRACISVGDGELKAFQRSLLLLLSLAPPRQITTKHGGSVLPVGAVYAKGASQAPEKAPRVLGRPLQCAQICSGSGDLGGSGMAAHSEPGAASLA
eukprot:COSAG06_NODE_10892_length_1600_cov_1.778814_3_plen_129_part_01